MAAALIPRSILSGEAHPPPLPTLSDTMFAKRADEYPYDISPLVVMTQMEERLFPTHTRAHEAVQIADAIAASVKEKLHAEVVRIVPAAESPDESLRIASTSRELMKKYMLLIAEHILAQGYFYDQRSTYHEGILEKERHKDWPLDCDLTSHIALHVAGAHDMPVAGVESLHHMYVMLLNFPDVVEMTEMGKPEFFQTHEQKKSQDRLHPDAAALLGLYRRMSQRQLEQIITGNLLNSIVFDTNAAQKGVKESEDTCEVGEEILRDYGPGYLNVHGVVAAHGDAADAYMRQTGDPSPERGRRQKYHHERRSDLVSAYGDLLNAPTRYSWMR